MAWNFPKYLLLCPFVKLHNFFHIYLFIFLKYKGWLVCPSVTINKNEITVAIIEAERLQKEAEEAALKKAEEEAKPV